MSFTFLAYMHNPSKGPQAFVYDDEAHSFKLATQGDRSVSHFDKTMPFITEDIELGQYFGATLPCSGDDNIPQHLSVAGDAGARCILRKRWRNNKFEIEQFFPNRSEKWGEPEARIDVNQAFRNDPYEERLKTATARAAQNNPASSALIPRPANIDPDAETFHQDYSTDSISILLDKFHASLDDADCATAQFPCLSAKDVTTELLQQFVIRLFAQGADAEDFPGETRIALPLQLSTNDDSSRSGHFVLAAITLTDVNEDDAAIVKAALQENTEAQLLQSPHFLRHLAGVFRDIDIAVVDSVTPTSIQNEAYAEQFKRVSFALLQCFQQLELTMADIDLDSVIDEGVPIPQTGDHDCGPIMVEHGKQFLRDGTFATLPEDTDYSTYMDRTRRQHLREGGERFKATMRDTAGVGNATEDTSFDFHHSGAIACINRVLNQFHQQAELKDGETPQKIMLQKTMNESTREHVYQTQVNLSDGTSARMSVYKDSLYVDTITEESARMMIESFIHACSAPGGYAHELPPSSPLLIDGKPLTIAISSEQKSGYEIIAKVAKEYQLKVATSSPTPSFRHGSLASMDEDATPPSLGLS